MPLPSPRDPVEVDLSGRAILVTGASGGLGRPLAIACARRGATVVLHGRVVRKLEAIYDEIVAAGAPQPTILPLDLAVASADDFGQIAGAIRAQLGRLDGLVHTAAFLGSLGPIEHQSFDVWQKVLRVNLSAAMALTRSMLPLLAAAPDAAVVFTLDTRGDDPRAYWGSYAAAKAGLVGAGRDAGGRMGGPAQSARRCGRSGSDALAASRVDASRRGSRGAAAARGAGAALPPSPRGARESRERRTDRRARRGSRVSRPPRRSSPPLVRSEAPRAAAGSPRAAACRAARRRRRRDATRADRPLATRSP